MTVRDLYGTTISTSIYLADVYRNLETQIYQGKQFQTSKADMAKAKTLETFLNWIKKYQQNPNVTGLWPAMENEATQQTLQSLLQSVNSPLLQTTQNNYMNLNYSGGSPWMQGRILENLLTTVSRSFEAISSGRKYQSGGQFNLGEKHQQLTLQTNIINNIVSTPVGNRGINLTQEFDPNELAKKYLARAYYEAREELNKYKDESFGPSNAIPTYIHSVQGKIDNVGLKASVQATCTSVIANDIIEALKGATFTAKNYSGSTISFGQTNPFRIFMATANSDNVLGQWYRMLGCFDAEHYDTQTSLITFYKIRVAYEVTGAGSQRDYVDNEVNKLLNDIGATHAKYLVYNQPGGGIYVVPTSTVTEKIRNQIMKTLYKTRSIAKEDALYKKITIQASQLQ